jgi:hypothetical protein
MWCARTTARPLQTTGCRQPWQLCPLRACFKLCFGAVAAHFGCALANKVVRVWGLGLWACVWACGRGRGEGGAGLKLHNVSLWQ